MPYIYTKTNVEITKDKEVAIKIKLGKAIELIPGKSENWLMLSFEGQCPFYFKGNGEKAIAYVEVKLFGSSTEDAYAKLTSEITKILKDELNIAPSEVYVTYTEVKHWGWNGNNF